MKIKLLFFLLLSLFYSCQNHASNNNSQFQIASVNVQLPQDPPLTPSNGGKSIDGRSLAVGDIIFSSVENTSSMLIRKFTGGGPASHVAVVSDIIAGIVFVIEAISSGVRKVPLEAFLAENSNAVAFRYPNISSSQTQLLSSYLNERIGANYDYFGAGSSPFFKLDERKIEVDYGQYKTRKTYCSKLLIEAFQVSNISICELTGGWSTPNELVTLTWTDTLTYVGHLKYTP